MKKRSRGGSPCVFLDRDGTLIHDKPGFYLTRPEQIRYYAGTFPGLRLLRRSGFRLVVLTNQSGIGRGFISKRTLGTVHKLISRRLASEGILLDGIYFCPHVPADGCECRKPKPTLAMKAARDLSLSLEGSFVIGDKKADIDLAKAVGIPSVLVLTGHGRSQLASHGRRLSPSHVSKSILEAARWIVNQASGKRDKEK